MNGVIVGGTDFAAYRTLSPSEFWRLRTGTCWDYVEVQRDYYTQRGIAHTTFYIEGSDPACASHTVIIRQEGDEYVWDEAAWKSELGETRAKTQEALLVLAVQLHQRAMAHGGATVSQLHTTVYAYTKPDKFGMTVDEFMDHCKNGIKVCEFAALQ